MEIEGLAEPQVDRYPSYDGAPDRGWTTEAGDQEEETS
jgi:hypothetical protein